MSIFKGAGVAIVTPMNEDGSINYDVYRALIDDQIKKGTDAIVAVGTSGEAPTLDDEEHIEAIRVAVEAAAGRVPVVAGTGSNNTAHAVMMSKEAEKVGADALLLVAPYYNKATQKGLIAHFTAIAESTGLPAILYNVPSRTGSNILPETAAFLGKNVKNVAAVKEASGNISQVAKLIELAEGSLDVYSGNDDQIVPIWFSSASTGNIPRRRPCRSAPWSSAGSCSARSTRSPSKRPSICRAGTWASRVFL